MWARQGCRPPVMQGASAWQSDAPATPEEFLNALGDKYGAKSVVRRQFADMHSHLIPSGNFLACPFGTRRQGVTALLSRSYQCSEMIFHAKKGDLLR